MVESVPAMKSLSLTHVTLRNYRLESLLNFTQVRKNKLVTQGAQALGKSWVHIPAPILTNAFFFETQKLNLFKSHVGKLLSI